MMTRKDDEIARVAAQLDSLLDEMAASVEALNVILMRPLPPEPGTDEKRLVAP